MFKFKKAFLAFGTRKDTEFIFFEFMLHIKKVTKRSPYFVLFGALENVKPSFELRPKKVAGAKYNLPYLLSADRAESFAIRSLIKNGILRAEVTLAEKVAQEVVEAYSFKGNTYKQLILLNEEVSRSRPFFEVFT